MLSFIKQSAFLFIFTIAFLLLPSYCHADEIKVNLVWKFPEPKWLEIEITEGVYKLSFDEENMSLKSGEKFILGQGSLARFISINNNLRVINNPAIILTTHNHGVFRIREPGKDWVSYRGSLTVSKENLSWELINTVDREDYLKGVVPIEMSNAWAVKGFEALKAQAVAARTYLLKNMDKNDTITDSPNIHQAYWGRSVEGEASKAVEATAGEILVDKDTREPISIFYSSHNGGYSEETQNVWQSHDPHYRSERDYFSEEIGGYVNKWRFAIAADTLGYNFGLAPVREIVLNKYISGRVYEVTLLDWLGNKKSISCGDFVKKFYPYTRAISIESFLGRLFDVNYIIPRNKVIRNRPLLISGNFDTRNNINNQNTAVPGPLLSRLKSSNEGVSVKPRQFGVFVFNGRGWGHGVGMSQWGAYNMAMQGYSYDTILTHYYKNSVLEKK